MTPWGCFLPGEPCPQGLLLGHLLFFFIFKIYFILFIYLFLAALGLRCCGMGFSLVVVSGGCSSLRCMGFSSR